VRSLLDDIRRKSDALALAPFNEITAAEFRQQPQLLASHSLPTEDLYKVCDYTMGGTQEGGRFRVYTPSAATSLPILIFLHGGCWVFCDLSSHDSICRYISKQLGVLVVAVDYRLAPEHKYPAALQDTYAVATWLQHHGAEIGGDANRLAIAGDSAGGNIAAAVSMMARDQGDFNFQSQWLLYPIVNIAQQNTVSYGQYNEGYFFEKKLLDWCIEHYLPDASHRFDPYISPLLAKNLSNLPYTLIQTAEFDILRDEGERFGSRLSDAGNSVDVIRYTGMVHAFVAMAGSVDVARMALDEGIETLREQWLSEGTAVGRTNSKSLKR
jgi:acetyl esterase/lipase